MKKFLLFIVFIAMICIGCDDSKSHTLKYVIFYPGYADTIIVNNDDGKFKWGTDRDGNYINMLYGNWLTKKVIYHNTDPFKIISYNYK